MAIDKPIFIPSLQIYDSDLGTPKRNGGVKSRQEL